MTKINTEKIFPLQQDKDTPNIPWAKEQRDFCVYAGVDTTTVEWNGMLSIESTRDFPCIRIYGGALSRVLDSSHVFPPLAKGFELNPDVPALLLALPLEKDFLQVNDFNGRSIVTIVNTGESWKVSNVGDSYSRTVGGGICH